MPAAQRQETTAAARRTASAVLTSSAEDTYRTTPTSFAASRRRAPRHSASLSEPGQHAPVESRTVERRHAGSGLITAIRESVKARQALEVDLDIAA